jgi:hypothetical protein
MRSFLFIAVNSLLLLAISAGSALAAGPEHITVRGTDTDPDFCGTGQSVDVSFRGVLNLSDDKASGHITNTWTNPATGVRVIDSFSGGGMVRVIDDGDGAYTVVSTRTGVPESIKMANGPLIYHDAGLVRVYDHFDADDNYLGTDVVVRGPHPGLDSGFNLWCPTMIEALGL